MLVTDTRPGGSSTVTSPPAALTIQTVAGPTTALAGYWKFDEGAGTTAADSTPNSRNATLNYFPGDSTTWVTGKIGGALAFGGPGTFQYAFVPNYVQTTDNSLTLSAWVWADALNGLDAIVDTFGQTVVPPGGQYRMGMSRASALQGSVAALAANAVSATEAAGFPTGSWQHVAFVADGATLRLYRNGAQVASNAYNSTVQLGTLITNLLIGARVADDGVNPDPTNGCFWTGKMDDLGFWTRGLSPREVYQVFYNGSQGLGVTNPLPPNPPPVITKSPPSENIYLHEPFWPALRVEASYYDQLSYQWWKNGALIADATNSTYGHGGTVDFTDAGSYSVVVTGGGLSATSSAAVVTISAPTPQIDDGMVLHLKLDDSSGTTAIDSTTNANNGTLVNFTDPNTNWVSGVANGALQLNVGGDANDAVQVPYQPYLDFGPGSFSISLCGGAGCRNQTACRCHTPQTTTSTTSSKSGAWRDAYFTCPLVLENKPESVASQRG